MDATMQCPKGKPYEDVWVAVTATHRKFDAAAIAHELLWRQRYPEFRQFCRDFSAQIDRSRVQRMAETSVIGGAFTGIDCVYGFLGEGITDWARLEKIALKDGGDAGYLIAAHVANLAIH